MRKVFLSIIVVAAAAATITSCNKVEGCSDPDGLNYNAEVKEKNDDGSCTYKSDVVNAVGDYSYSLNIYGNGFDETSTATKKATVSQDGDNIKITMPVEADFWDNETVFVGNNIASATNGFTFDVKDGTVVSSDGSTSYSGYDAAKLGDVNYNGLYDYDAKEITFGISFIEDGETYYGVFTLKK